MLYIRGKYLLMTNMKSDNQNKKVPDMHFGIEKAKEFVRQGLLKYVPDENKVNKIIARYDDKVIRSTGATIQSEDVRPSLKKVNIPHITKYQIGDYTIRDIESDEYGKLSSVMGMIVNCCAFYGGSGTQLCNAVKNSPWFKIMVIEKESEVKALTVVCSDKAQRTLVILGLETSETNLSANKKQTYRNLINYASSEMIKNNKYERVLFSAGGVGMPNIGYGSRNDFPKAETYSKLIELASVSNLPVISLENQKFNISIMDGKKYGFETLHQIPESAVCVELRRKEINLNQNSDDSDSQNSSLDFSQLSSSPEEGSKKMLIYREEPKINLKRSKSLADISSIYHQ